TSERSLRCLTAAGALVPSASSAIRSLSFSSVATAGLSPASPGLTDEAATAAGKIKLAADDPDPGPEEIVAAKPAGDRRSERLRPHTTDVIDGRRRENRLAQLTSRIGSSERFAVAAVFPEGNWVDQQGGVTFPREQHV